MQGYLLDRRARAVGALIDSGPIFNDEHGSYAMRQAFRSGQIDGVRAVSDLPVFVKRELESIAESRLAEEVAGEAL